MRHNRMIRNRLECSGAVLKRIEHFKKGRDEEGQ